MKGYKIVTLICLFLFGGNLLWGQYSSSGTISNPDVLASTCMSPPSGYTCWLPYNTSGTTFTQLSIGNDGTLWALDASGTIWQGTLSTTAVSPNGITWTKFGNQPSGYVVSQIAVANAGRELILTTTSTSGTNVWAWNTSTNAFDTVGAKTCSQIAVAPGQSGSNSANNIWCLDSSGTAWQMNSSGAWVSNGPGVALANISASGDGSALGMGTGGVNLWLYNPFIGWVATSNSTLGWTPSKAAGALAIGGAVSVGMGGMLVVDTSNNIHISHSGSANGVANWYTPVSNIPSGAPRWTTSPSADVQFVVGPAGGYIYHLNTFPPQVSTTVTGSCGSACSGDPSEEVDISVETSFYNASTQTPTYVPSTFDGDWEGYASTNVDFIGSSSTIECDPLLPGSDDSDSPCDIGITATAIVIATGDLLYDGSGTSSVYNSKDLRYWDGKFSQTDYVGTPPTASSADFSIGVSISACAPGTEPTCAVQSPYIYEYDCWDGSSSNPCPNETVMYDDEHLHAVFHEPPLIGYGTAYTFKTEFYYEMTPTGSILVCAPPPPPDWYDFGGLEACQ